MFLSDQNFKISHLKKLEARRFCHAAPMMQSVNCGLVEVTQISSFYFLFFDRQAENIRRNKVHLRCKSLLRL